MAVTDEPVNIFQVVSQFFGLRGTRHASVHPCTHPPVGRTWTGPTDSRGAVCCPFASGRRPRARHGRRSHPTPRETVGSGLRSSPWPPRPRPSARPYVCRHVRVSGRVVTQLHLPWAVGPSRTCPHPSLLSRIRTRLNCS